MKIFKLLALGLFMLGSSLYAMEKEPDPPVSVEDVEYLSNYFPFLVPSNICLEYKDINNSIHTLHRKVDRML